MQRQKKKKSPNETKQKFRAAAHTLKPGESAHLEKRETMAHIFL